VWAAQLANQDQQPGRQPMTRAKTKAKANRPARCAGKCRKWLVPAEAPLQSCQNGPFFAGTDITQVPAQTATIAPCPDTPRQGKTITSSANRYGRFWGDHRGSIGRDSSRTPQTMDGPSRLTTHRTPGSMSATLYPSACEKSAVDDPAARAALTNIAEHPVLNPFVSTHVY
jgi:hypothetical protein